MSDRRSRFVITTDIVCAPGFGASASNHTDYDSAEENDMGLWAADLYLGLPTPPTS